MSRQASVYLLRRTKRRHPLHGVLPHGKVVEVVVGNVVTLFFVKEVPKEARLDRPKDATMYLRIGNVCRVSKAEQHRARICLERHAERVGGPRKRIDNDRVGSFGHFRTAFVGAPRTEAARLGGGGTRFERSKVIRWHRHPDGIRRHELACQGLWLTCCVVTVEELAEESPCMGRALTMPCNDDRSPRVVMLEIVEEGGADVGISQLESAARGGGVGALICLYVCLAVAGCIHPPCGIKNTGLVEDGATVGTFVEGGVVYGSVPVGFFFAPPCIDGRVYEKHIGGGDSLVVTQRGS